MKTECKRCQGNGMPGYKHNADGMCFACGRFPGGGAPEGLAPLPARSIRERVICYFTGCLERAKDEVASGDASFWWADVQPDVRCYLGLAPADVKARALAAFGKLGLRVD